jgi:phosphatidyl-myo-inositol dimannoside synthase
MKTLLFTLEYPPFKGGVAKYYSNIVKHWPETDGIFVLNNNKNKILKNFIYPKWIFSIFLLRKTILQNKIDHVLVGHILPLGTVMYLLTKFMKIKYSVIIHGMDINFAVKNTRKRILTEKILKGADKIICANSFTADFIRINFDKILGSRIRVVNPGIETDIEINHNRADELRIKHRIYNHPLIFSIGRLVKRKGFDNTLEAMHEIQKYYPNLFYVIAGDGPDKQYIKNKSKGLSNIIFLGKISDADKWAWMSMCDIFAMPSRDVDGDIEGFGIVYLEAGLCGKAVVAGVSGGVRDAVLSAKTGIMIDSKNIEKIANSIMKLLKDSELRMEMGSNARRRIVENFNVANQVIKIYDIINKS